MEIKDIKERLADRAASVAAMLLPGGKKLGNEWQCGDVSGTSGKSLSVNISGTKAGIWSDFATGAGGDLLDLWVDVKGISLVEALDEAREYLGIEVPKFQTARVKEFNKPDKPRCAAPSGEILLYLSEDRGLTYETIDAFKIGATDRGIIFPFLKDGELVMAKYRELDGKPIPTASGCKPILFGWQTIPDDAREVVICEGEIDAMSMFQAGLPALSVPFGAGSGGKHNWIEHEYADLDRFETIYICMDADGPGEAAAADLVERLGRHRCKIVDLPENDVNDCLLSGVDILNCVANAKFCDPEELCRASDFREAVADAFNPNSASQSGYSVPWGGFDNLKFRPHELSLWTGASGAGKSQLLSHALVDFMGQGAKCCLASLEMTPAQTLKRMVKQAGNIDQPTDHFLDTVIDWFDDKLWLYNHQGMTTVDKLIEGFEYARKRFGVDTFVIDSLMRLSGIGVDDYKAQAAAIFKLTDWAVSRPVHLHLVAHARKGQDGGAVPDIESVKGTSEIAANAFLILGVWRNRKLEDDLAQAILSGGQEEIDRLNSIPAVEVSVAKDRNGLGEGKRSLFFHRRTFRYYSGRVDGREYVPSTAPTEP
mgnify:CR=1 FL=1